MNNRHIPLTHLLFARTLSAMPRALECVFRRFYMLKFRILVRVLAWKREAATAGRLTATEMKALLKQVGAARKERQRGKPRTFAAIP